MAASPSDLKFDTLVSSRTIYELLLEKNSTLVPGCKLKINHLKLETFFNFGDLHAVLYVCKYIVQYMCVHTAYTVCYLETFKEIVGNWQK